MLVLSAGTVPLLLEEVGENVGDCILFNLMLRRNFGRFRSCGYTFRMSELKLKHLVLFFVVLLCSYSESDL